MKKFAFLFGLIFAVIGAVLTLIVVSNIETDSGLTPQSKAADLWFGIGICVIAPAFHAAKLLGFSRSMSKLQWDFLAIVINTTLCFLCGVLLGLVVRLMTRLTARNSETTG